MDERIDGDTFRGAALLLCCIAAMTGCLDRGAASYEKTSDATAADATAADATAADATAANDLGGPPCLHPKVVKSCTGEWCQIPAGCFVMGSPKDEPCRSDNEDRHKVTLTRGFKIQQTEVTQGQFQSLMGYNPSDFGPNGKFGDCGPTCPVETVRWHEAAAYCNALSAKASAAACYSCTGSGAQVVCEEAPAYRGAKVYACPGFRLPTEAEFEYAYRAGTTTAYYSGPNDPQQCQTCGPGDANLDPIAWYCPNAGSKPLPVKHKQPNAWGLHDMAGSVGEYCHDRYQEHLGSAAVTDPWGSAASGKRVRRGGSWIPSAAYLRAARRDPVTAVYRWIEQGFRCVRSTGVTPPP